MGRRWLSAERHHGRLLSAVCVGPMTRDTFPAHEQRAAPGTRVLVAGGGIGGLTAGVALLKAGLDPVVIERHAAPAEAGAGLSLWPNAVHPLRALGLGDAIDAVGLEPAGGALRLANGRTLASLPGAQLAGRFGAPVLVVHRADLVGLLRAALPATALREGIAITEVAQDDDGVTVTLAGGEQLEAALLVGADGVHSLVRERVWGDPPAAPSGVVVRAVVPAGAELAQLEGETWGRGTLFGAAPLRGERIYWFAAAAADQDGDPDPERERDALRAAHRTGRAAPPAAAGRNAQPRAPLHPDVPDAAQPDADHRAPGVHTVIGRV